MWNTLHRYKSTRKGNQFKIKYRFLVSVQFGIPILSDCKPLLFALMRLLNHTPRSNFNFSHETSTFENVVRPRNWTYFN